MKALCTLQFPIVLYPPPLYVHIYFNDDFQRVRQEDRYQTSVQKQINQMENVLVISEL